MNRKRELREIAELTRARAFNAERAGKPITGTEFHEIARKLESALAAAPVEPRPRLSDLRVKVQSWANNCAVYEEQHSKESTHYGSSSDLSAHYHRGAKEAYQRVADTLLAQPAPPNECPVCKKPCVLLVNDEMCVECFGKKPAHARDRLDAPPPTITVTQGATPGCTADALAAHGKWTEVELPPAPVSQAREAKKLVEWLGGSSKANSVERVAQALAAAEQRARIEGMEEMHRWIEHGESYGEYDCCQIIADAKKKLATPSGAAQGGQIEP